MSASLLAAGGQEFARDVRAAAMLVARNGVLVYEGYANGSTALEANNIHSVAKSMTSALCGIAIREGFIHSIDQPIYQLLPTYHFASWARAITVRHLLTMRTGWRWKDERDEERIIARSSNWVQAIIDCPQAAAPGARFTYSSANSHLLGAIVAVASGRSLCEFSKQYLFGPLGITVEKWGVDPQGFFGRDNVYITPRELARFGQLYLDRGWANGRQLVPEQWVADSQVSAGNNYGLMWWAYPLGTLPRYMAWGYGGNLLYVLPTLKLVVAFTQTTNTSAYRGDRDQLVSRYIVGAISGG
jgi:CubicO group peptidase (beta-lactamase class C family)